ncbi:hypothetical protein PanWU01x14_195970 [Parasponia andersonii]|uniref:Secreted protein n=1 Tax=Parasponia andersonii TaxID=3476 RepID=A0A2P5BZZ8_PARAD|nr:hypothetical protein PanWU01x14_195970 [Parasponia andersonii]
MVIIVIFSSLIYLRLSFPTFGTEGFVPDDESSFDFVSLRAHPYPIPYHCAVWYIAEGTQGGAAVATATVRSSQSPAKLPNTAYCPRH